MTPDDAVFETERTVVRDWRASDQERVFDIYSRWDVAKWLGSDPRALDQPEQAGQTIQRWSERNLAAELGGIWAVERKDDGVVAGTALLVPMGDEGDYEVGWHFHPDSWGFGYASESARGALAFGWAKGLPQILAVVRPGNDASIAVCRRIGMEHLGRTSQYYDAELELFRVAAPPPTR